MWIISASGAINNSRRLSYYWITSCLAIQYALICSWSEVADQSYVQSTPRSTHHSYLYQLAATHSRCYRQLVCWTGYTAVIDSLVNLGSISVDKTDNQPFKQRPTSCLCPNRIELLTSMSLTKEQCIHTSWCVSWWPDETPKHNSRPVYSMTTHDKIWSCPDVWEKQDHRLVYDR